MTKTVYFNSENKYLKAYKIKLYLIIVQKNKRSIYKSSFQKNKVCFQLADYYLSTLFVMYLSTLALVGLIYTFEHIRYNQSLIILSVFLVYAAVMNVIGLFRKHDSN